MFDFANERKRVRIFFTSANISVAACERRARVLYRLRINLKRRLQKLSGVKTYNFISNVNIKIIIHSRLQVSYVERFFMNDKIFPSNQQSFAYLLYLKFS